MKAATKTAKKPTARRTIKISHRYGRLTAKQVEQAVARVTARKSK